MENHTFVPRARYLRLLRRRRYELLYHSVLRLCSEFRESRSFLWLNIKKSIHGKSSRIHKCGEARTRLPRVYTRISRLRSSRSKSSSPSCDVTKVYTLSGYVYGSVRKVRRGYELVRDESLSSNPYKIAICRLKLLNTELVLVYHSNTQMSFSKNLWSLFSRDF